MIIRRLIVGTMPFVLGGLLGCGDTGAKQLPESGFQVAFESHNVASDMKSGKTVSADITVKNVSPVTWPSKPDNQDRYAVHLSYHWLNRKGATVVFDGLRTPLPRDLKPGESVNLKATIQAPAEPGRHTLEVTLVQEHSAWFPEKKGAKLVLPVTVSEGSEVTADAAAATQRSEKTEKSETQSANAGKAPLKKDAAGQTAAKTNKPAGAVDGGSGPWSVQLGSYAEKKVAASLVKKLKDKGYDAYVTVTDVKGKELHRVRVGRFEQRAEAEKLRETLKTAEKLERAVVTSR
jgi:cell division septation protein DedD